MDNPIHPTNFVPVRILVPSTPSGDSENVVRIWAKTNPDNHLSEITPANTLNARIIETNEDKTITLVEEISRSLISGKSPQSNAGNINQLFELSKNKGLHFKKEKELWKPLLQTLTKNTQLLANIEKLSPHVTKKICDQISRFHLSHQFISSLDHINDEIVWGAITNNCPELLTLLLASGAHVHLDSYGKTPLMCAAEAGYPAIVQALINASKPGSCCFRQRLRGINFDLNLEEKDKIQRTALMLAVEAGHTEVVKLLIGAGAQLDTLSGRRKTVLMLAAEKGHTEVIKLLIKAGAQLNTIDFRGRTALMLAAEKGHTEVVRALARARASLDDRSCSLRRTALMLAAEKGHIETVQALIDAGANPSIGSFGGIGQTALMLAAEKGYTEVVRALARERASLDDQCLNPERTALMLAAEKGHIETVQALIDAGANPSIRSFERTGQTALMLAAEKGHTEVVRALARERASLDDQCLNPRRTALMLAAEKGHIETVQALIDAGANLSIKSSEYPKQTALMLAIEAGHTEVAKKIIDTIVQLNTSVQLNTIDAGGNTALMLAAAKRDPTILSALIDAGADVQIQDREGNTALMAAVKKGCARTFDALLLADADIHAANTDNHTAFSLAAQYSNTRALKILFHRGAEIDGPTEACHTPLMLAAMYGTHRTLQTLIDLGADINKKNREGLTPLAIAACCMNVEAIHYLIEKGAQLNTDPSGYTELMIFAMTERANARLEFLRNNSQSNIQSINNQAEYLRLSSHAIIESLISIGAQLEATDHEGQTALMHAAKSRHPNPELLQALLTARANIEAKDLEGKTALMHAAQSRNTTAVKTLIAANADIEAKDLEGKTALMHAARSGNLAVLEDLLLEDADIQATDFNGRTALAHARESGNFAAQNELERELERQGRDHERDLIPQNGISFQLPLNPGHISLHQILNNTLLITITNPLNTTPENAKQTLKLIAKYLHQYRVSGGRFAALRLNVKYQGQEGTDVGGLSRDFISQILKPLFIENPYFSEENSYYRVINQTGDASEENLQLCKDIGTFLAAIFSGFPQHSSAKIGGVFSDLFFNQLLAIYKYGQENTLIPFNSMDPETQEKFTKALSDYDIENTVYKNIQHHFEKEILTNQELDDIVYFLIHDHFEGGDLVDEEISILLTDFVNLPDSFTLFKNFIISPSIEFTKDNGEIVNIKELLRNQLRTILEDANKKSLVRQKFLASRTDAYENISIPLAEIGEGFKIVSKRRITPLILAFAADPLDATQKLAHKIQGAPFSKEVFVNWIHNATFSPDIEAADLEAVHEKLGWLIEWCDRGISDGQNGEEDLQATEEEMKKTLQAITGATHIPNQLNLRFDLPIDGMSVFHTCFNSVNMGRVLLNTTDKRIFIRNWIINVNEALESGFTLS